MLNIQLITLKAGSHSDTNTTGSGCFMNVVAYLNGEPQITDSSPCVCPVVRCLAIWGNDFALGPQFTAKQHKVNSDRLLPFVLRAIGSATTDTAELSRRAWLAVDFARAVGGDGSADAADATYAAAGATYAYASAVNTANAADATYAATAYAYAASAYDANATAAYEHILDMLIIFLDKALPPADEQTQAVIYRAEQLIAMCRKTGTCV